MIFSRLACVATSLATVVLSGVVLVACGSPAPEESSAESREALVKAPVCPSWGCGGNPVLNSPPTCTIWPRPQDANAGYTPAWYRTGGFGCYLDTGFSDAMKAFGCQPEFYYQEAPQTTPETGFVVPVALCPGVPQYTTPLTPDACTGTPPNGWTFVTWYYYAPCYEPGTGCHSGACATF